jgi:hypothetical protein
MKNEMVRAWVNAPSKLQEEHKNHGKKLLVLKEDLQNEMMDGLLKENKHL